MISTCCYGSPLGDILLAADEVGLIGLWFEGQKYFASTLPAAHTVQETPPLTQARRWLDVYFSGQQPDFTPPLHLVGSPFRQAVWTLLLQIPYGQTTTYGALAQQLAAQTGAAGIRPGGGRGRGPQRGLLIIPCHRVVGTNGSLTGYAGALTEKSSCWNWKGGYAAVVCSC